VVSTILLAAFSLIAAAVTWTLAAFTRLDPVSAGLSGAVVFLALAQVRAMLRNARDRDEIEESLAEARANNSALKKALEDTKLKISEVTTALAKKTDAQEKKVTSELMIIEGLIREFAGNVVRRAPNASIGASETLAVTADIGASHPRELTDPALLEIIKQALEENRVDLHLQPVVSLPQRKVRFYEALTRLRSADGAVIMPSQYIKLAAPAGLMSVVDNLLLFRCVQVLRRLAQRSRDVGIFCNISGHTLNDSEFFPQFLEFLTNHKDLSGQIIFEFAQASVLEAGAAGEANLKALAALGFRLSMDQVTKLNADFAKLKRLGFSFVKVRADTLISGMRDARASVAAEDFKDLLARSGLNLIVERIEDEKSVVQLLEYAVDFGQGYLFGEPRPIRELQDIHDPRSRESAKGAMLPSVIRRLAS
jgi:cyclic-di-GMP phosphodiesterase, flagellum assembly factor TipF